MNDTSATREGVSINVKTGMPTNKQGKDWGTPLPCLHRSEVILVCLVDLEVILVCLESL